MNPVFRSKFAENIFNQKYKHENAQTWDELCETLVEDVCREFMPQDEKDRLIEHMRKMRFIPAGRYLYYAGRDVKAFNNCFILKSQEDTREDWAKLSWKAESCLSSGGGIGNDYSVYRARGSKLKRTGGEASGPVSKMRMTNEIGREVMQGGSRRSAIYASLNWKHPDIEEFLTAKNWYDMPVAGTDLSIGDLREADFNYPAPLDMTNMSTNYDTEWLMEYWRTGDVGEVFRKNTKQAMQFGEPGFSFNFLDKEKETGRNACVTGETLILTEQGYKEIKDLVGELVKVWNGESFEQVEPYETGVQDVVKVTLSDGSELHCTWNHKWVVDGCGEFVETIDLKVGDKLAKFDMPVVYFGEGCEDQKPAYSQGFYSGDGNKGYTYSFVYEPKYPCMKRLVGAFSGEDNQKRVRWTHGAMLDKSYVPMDESQSYKLNWLAGLLDADGTVTKDKNGSGFQIVSIDHDFLNRVRLMLTTMGVRAKVVHAGNEEFRSMPDGNGGMKDYLCKETKRLLIGNYDAWFLMKSGLKLERLDHNGVKPQRDARRFVRVVSIEPMSEDKMTYCFTEPKTSRGTFNGIVTGQCGEATSEDDSDVCNLGSMNFSRIHDLEQLMDATYLASKFLYCGSMVADLPYDKVKEVRKKNRRQGLGLMGLHEWLIMRGDRYEVTPEMHKWLAVYEAMSEKGANEVADANGLNRPKAYRAIAPTGSIGILAGTTTGIEPIFSVAYKRRYLKGETWHYEYVVDSAAMELIKRYDVDPDSIETALDLAEDFERRIKFQADVQDYVDMAISSTINLPAWGSENNNEELVDKFCETLAKYAHRLRGFTAYPDGARGGQPLVRVPYDEAKDKLGEVFEESVVAHDICDISGKGGSCGV